MQVGPRKRILIVDDSPTQLCLFAALLEGPRYEIRSAADGVQAVELALSFLPQLVILDLKLPPWGGFEVARRIKLDPRTRSALILAVSGYDRAQVEGKLIGIEAFLPKPIGADELRAAVASLL